MQVNFMKYILRIILQIVGKDQFDKAKLNLQQLMQQYDTIKQDSETKKLDLNNSIDVLQIILPQLSENTTINYSRK